MRASEDRSRKRERADSAGVRKQQRGSLSGQAVSAFFLSPCCTPAAEDTGVHKVGRQSPRSSQWRKKGPTILEPGHLRGMTARTEGGSRPSVWGARRCLESWTGLELRGPYRSLDLS